MTNSVTRAYNTACRVPGNALVDVMRTVEADARIPTWKRPYPPRPVFVPQDRIHGFADDLMQLLGMLTTLPERLFDGDLDRFMAAVGVHGARAELMRRHAPETPRLSGRADAYHDGTGFKLLEFGIGSDLGGWDWAGEVPRALLEVDGFASFAREHGLDYVHTGRATVRTIKEAAAAYNGVREPVVALVEAPGGMDTFGSIWHNLHRVMRGLGLDLHLAELTELQEKDGRLVLNGLPIDVVWRAFDTDQLLENTRNLELAEPVFRAHEAGQTLLWHTLQSNLFGEKACMALLSDPRYAHGFSAEERRVIERALPWTRSLQGPAALQDTALVEQLRDRREHLILKPDNLFGGYGVVAGWETGDDEWWTALTEGAAAGCVVQERVVPQTELMVDPATGTEQPWQTLWGVFYHPDGYAGAHARVIPADSSAVIGLRCIDRIHTGSVFHY
ncbi:hypothetical protein P3T37_000115 [Kitasatospora sp. MAA4]|uniref:hypothetical protein n=1 Tax=Kitasatospora sp. MAA4 TaxID=3035093 RepID=UPI002473C14C|nr:hypothetical protein [Kitasatospora sp. MAA4]MDH6130748.1 hypothetical protein [Kitasatospora sp. MAA4]